MLDMHGFVVTFLFLYPRRMLCQLTVLTKTPSKPILTFTGKGAMCVGTGASVLARIRSTLVDIWMNQCMGD